MSARPISGLGSELDMKVSTGGAEHLIISHRFHSISERGSKRVDDDGKMRSAEPHQAKADLLDGGVLLIKLAHARDIHGEL